MSAGTTGQPSASGPSHAGLAGVLVPQDRGARNTARRSVTELGDGKSFAPGRGPKHLRVQVMLNS